MQVSAWRVAGVFSTEEGSRGIGGFGAEASVLENIEEIQRNVCVTLAVSGSGSAGRKGRVWNVVVATELCWSAGCAIEADSKGSPV